MCEIRVNSALRFISTSSIVSNMNVKVILQLFSELVRPHFDYAVQFRSPDHRVDINSHGNIQKTILSIINLPHDNI